jgi:hypothetical protein
MVAALETLRGLETKGRRIAVLGRMGELGPHSPEGHRHTGAAALSSGINLLIVVNSGDAHLIADGFLAAGGSPSQVHLVPDAATCAALKPATIKLHGGCRERRVVNLTNDELRLLAAVGLTAEPLLDLRGEPECCGGEAIYAAVWPDDAARAGRSLVKRTLGCNPTATSNARCASHLQRSGADATFAVIDWVLARCAGQESP